MIKNIFIDLDNTIIKDEIEDAEYYRNALEKYGYNPDDCYILCETIDLYEASLTEDNPCYNKRECMEFINKHLNKDYCYELVDSINEMIGLYWTKRVMIPEDIMRKLSEKYNLYVFTNYFGETQLERLKTIGYDKYFKKVFGADEYGLKKFNKSFRKVLDEIKAKPEECLFIGDSLMGDVAIPKKVGMEAILFDYDGSRNDKNLIKDMNVSDYKVMTDFNQIFELIENM